MKVEIELTLVVTLVLISCSAASDAPHFTHKPVASESKEGIRIDFAVSRETDVAVFVEDAQGKIIRHLVAGVLGKNPPAPLKAGALEQRVEWDGKADYGRPAGPGPFQVRVALGLSARYDRVLASDLQNNMGPIQSMSVGPDGTLYAVCSAGQGCFNWTGERLVALNREGKYLRTVLPFPSSLKRPQVEGFGVFELGGRPAPLLKSIYDRSLFSSQSPLRGGMAVTRDGVIVRVYNYRNWHPYFSLGACGVQGDLPWGADDGPPLLKAQVKAVKTRTQPFVCISGDGKYAYVSGLGESATQPPPFSGVHRVKLPERQPAEVFFGNVYEAGKDSAHLGPAPRGLAVDGKGHLLIADHANDRIVVVEESGSKYVGEFRVEKPDGLGVDPVTGALYVTSLAGSSLKVLKFNGWKEGKLLASLELPVEDRFIAPVMALDVTSNPHLVWIGRTNSLTRIEDKGTVFEAKKVIQKGTFETLSFEGMEVDRFQPDKEIYVRCGGGGNAHRFSEKTGEWMMVSFPGTAGSDAGVVLPGSGGVVYAPCYPMHLYRYNRDGKPLPWPAPTAQDYPKVIKGENYRPPGNGLYLPVGMTYMSHTVGVRPSDGHIFAFDSLKPGAKTMRALYEILPSGERVSQNPIIWKVSDTAVGPRFDAQGNIYIAEQIKPLGKLVPKELEQAIGPLELGKQYPSYTGSSKGALLSTYGSIVKFSAKGGMIHFERGKGDEDKPFVGNLNLDPALKTVDASFYVGERFSGIGSHSYLPVKVTGAEWIHLGISHVAMHYCNCETVRFDVDEFGRVWYPDLACFRVGVLDTNGNVITHFGGYGNADSCGPESSDKALAEPDLAFAWLISVGATDRYAYMGDSLNRRLLRAKLVYASEERTAVPAHSFSTDKATGE